MRKILACVDGSELSGSVVRQAFALAAANGSEAVEVLYVVDRKVEPPLLLAEYEYGADPIGDIRKAVEEQVEKFMKEDIKPVELEVPYEVNVIMGNPYKTIVKRAGKEDFDLIVMGHRGVKGMKRFYLGSVAAKVVAYSPCHVLVLRSGVAETPGKVLVAVDGSEESISVMGFGLDHALKVRAKEVLFLNVVEEVTEVPYTHGRAFDLVTDTPEFREKRVQSARERLESMLEQLNKEATRDTMGVKLRTEVGLGRSHAAIIEKAESEGSDLIVVGDRGKSGIEGFLLGSVSAKIVRYAPCGVLVYRTGYGSR